MPKLKPKTLDEQRAEALALLPKDEADQHAIFRGLLYPRMAYQHDFRENKPEPVTLISYGFDDRAEATIPTCVGRGKDGRTFRCSIDMMYLTEQEVWDKIAEDLQEAIRDLQRNLVEHTQNLVAMQLQLDDALTRTSK